MELFTAGVLLLCVLWALVGPLVSPEIERRLEWFLLGVGAVAATAGGAWSEAVALEAVMRPMKVCGAVLLGSLVFSFSHDNLRRALRRAMVRAGPRLAVGAAVALLGLAASLLTSAIAALALVELLRAMRLDRRSEVHVAVLGCFAVGLGGTLTPFAGPVPAIAMAKLAEAPYPVGPGFLAELLAPWVIPAVLALAAVAGLLFARPSREEDSAPEDPLSLWSILLLTGRMYVFIAGLVLLGSGLVGLVDRHLLGLTPAALYWINSISAVIDGATLASLELSPRMSQDQLRYILVGLSIAGGALITGSAVNVVAAHKLGIPQREWARAGVPTAAVMMVFFFVSLLAVEVM